MIQSSKYCLRVSVREKRRHGTEAPTCNDPEKIRTCPRWDPNPRPSDNSGEGEFNIITTTIAISI